MEVPILNAISPQRRGTIANIVDTKNVKHIPTIENINKEEKIMSYQSKFSQS